MKSLREGLDRLLLCLACAVGLACFVNSANADSLIVPGTANIFAAGESSTGGIGIAPGTLPPYIDFLPGAGLTLRFSSVVGLTNCCSGAPNRGPDGAGYSAFLTNINSFSGVSGIVAPSQSFLVGLFTNGSDYDGPAPARLDFNPAAGIGTNFASLSAWLWQTFWVGDGLTGTGSGNTQVFNVPIGASRLYLGFADGWGFAGNPGYYDDNRGSLTATFSVAGPQPIPEPGTLILLGFGLLGVAGYGKKKLRRKVSS